MIPLRDTNPSKTFPFINFLLIAANIVVFILERSLGKFTNDAVMHLGLVPARFLFDVQTMHLSVMTFIPFFSSMFLHGGWLHLLGNMLFLYIFGDNVEDKFGHFRYLIFYFIAGIAAASTQVYANAGSVIPMVGASGAIAGVLGAYVCMFPKAKVKTLIPLFFFFFKIIDLPAYFFLGIWFIIQIFSGMMSLGIGADAGGVAWWAHIGGFAAGALLFSVLRKSK